jgi:radical SAM superfamily enzyme YgiQ (UPF0313 family)
MNVLLLSLHKDLAAVGLSTLHRYLLDNGVASHMLHLPGFAAGDPCAAKALLDFVAKLSPGLIGVSLMSHNFFAACELTSCLKKAFPPVPILWGGVHPTAEPDSCLDHADMVCLGEGELATLEVVRAIQSGRDPAAAHNIAVRRDGKTIHNEMLPLIENLDQLPIGRHVEPHTWILTGGQTLPLDRKLLARHGRHAGGTYDILTSRGCPFACTYCSNSLYSQLYERWVIRRRSIAHVMAELEQAISDDRSLQFVNFLDDCFLACDDDYLQEFCRQYTQKIKLPFVARCIPKFVTPERLALLKDAGIAWINMGLQSGSDRVNTDVFGRKSLRGDFLRAARIIRRHKIAPIYDVILDNPFETDDDRLQTVRAMIEMPRPAYVELFSLCLFPGTRLLQRAQREGLPIHDVRKKDMFVFGRDRLNELIRMAAYLPPRWGTALVNLHVRKPQALQTRLAMRLGHLLCTMLIEPLAYLRIIRMSRRGSLLGMLRTLPSLFRVGFDRYYNMARQKRVARASRP